MNEMITFPDTWEEFEKLYGFNDAKEIYTNNSRLIPSFRVKQWLDHLSSIQFKLDNENGELINRQMAIDAIYEEWDGISYDGDGYHIASECERVLDALHPVQPRKGEWEIYATFDDCYYAKCNQCHETQVFYYNKQLTNFCPNCGADMRGGQDDNRRV